MISDQRGLAKGKKVVPTSWVGVKYNLSSNTYITYIQLTSYTIAKTESSSHFEMYKLSLILCHLRFNGLPPKV